MKIEDYMKKYSLSYKQVYDRIQKKELPAVKNGKEWDIINDIAPKVTTKAQNNLKDELTAVQIKKIQQQLEDGKRKIIDEFKSDVKQGIIEILIDLKSTIAKLKLKEKQLEKLNKCVNQSIKKLKL